MPLQRIGAYKRRIYAVCREIVFDFNISIAPLKTP